MLLYRFDKLQVLNKIVNFAIALHRVDLARRTLGPWSRNSENKPFVFRGLDFQKVWQLVGFRIGHHRASQRKIIQAIDVKLMKTDIR